MIEVLYLVKFAIFVAEKDLMEFNTSDPFDFSSCCTDEAAMLTQLVILTVLIISSNHVDKTVVNSKEGTDTWTKGDNELPRWLIDADIRYQDPDKGTVRPMI